MGERTVPVIYQQQGDQFKTTNSTETRDRYYIVQEIGMTDVIYLEGDFLFKRNYIIVRK